MNRREYIESLMGLPWKQGATGPDAFSCWGLTQKIQRDLFGRILPDVMEPEREAELIEFVRDHPARLQWRRIKKPVDGCLVEMSRYLDPCHSGTYLADDGGVVVHCARRIGVTVDSLVSLEAAGWRRIEFDAWTG